MWPTSLVYQSLCSKQPKWARPKLTGGATKRKCLPKDDLYARIAPVGPCRNRTNSGPLALGRAGRGTTCYGPAALGAAGPGAGPDSRLSYTNWQCGHVYTGLFCASMIRLHRVHFRPPTAAT